MLLSIINGLFYGALLGYMLWRVMDHYLQKKAFKEYIKELGRIAKILEHINKL